MPPEPCSNKNPECWVGAVKHECEILDEDPWMDEPCTPEELAAFATAFQEDAIEF